MNEIICKKCKLSNDALQEYCQLCGANLQGGKDSVPGNIFQVRMQYQFLDTFIAWEKDTLYVIPMTMVAAAGGGGAVGMASVLAVKKIQEDKYKKEIFPLPLDEQVTIQHGISVKFNEITQIKEKKGFLGVGMIFVYSKDKKPLFTVSGSKSEKEFFIQKAQSHGLEVILK